jgi:hypothetical protein
VPAVFHWAFDGTGAGSWDYAPNWQENDVPNPLYDTLVFPAGSTNCNFKAYQNHLTEVGGLVFEEGWGGFIACENLRIVGDGAELWSGTINVDDDCELEFGGEATFIAAEVQVNTNVPARVTSDEFRETIRAGATRYINATVNVTGLRVEQGGVLEVRNGGVAYVDSVGAINPQTGMTVHGDLVVKNGGTFQVRNAIGDKDTTRTVYGSGTITVESGGWVDLYAASTSNNIGLKAEVYPAINLDGGKLLVRAGSGNGAYQEGNVNLDGAVSATEGPVEVWVGQTVRFGHGLEMVGSEFTIRYEAGRSPWMWVTVDGPITAWYSAFDLTDYYMETGSFPIGQIVQVAHNGTLTMYGCSMDILVRHETAFPWDHINSAKWWSSVISMPYEDCTLNLIHGGISGGSTYFHNPVESGSQPVDNGFGTITGQNNWVKVRLGTGRYWYEFY